MDAVHGLRTHAGVRADVAIDFGFPLMAFSLFCLLPSAPYVKVYLLNNGAYVAKKKTKIARKTLDPLYQQALLFEESPQGKVLQVMSVYIYFIYIFCFDSNVLFHYR